MTLRRSLRADLFSKFSALAAVEHGCKVVEHISCHGGVQNALTLDEHFLLLLRREVCVDDAVIPVAVEQSQQAVLSNADGGDVGIVAQSIAADHLVDAEDPVAVRSCLHPDNGAVSGD
jgi:hypothetical protein